MKLWRKMAMKEGKQDGKRPGRAIKQTQQMQEYIFRNSPRTYPLLDALFKRAGMSYALSAKQQDALRNMIAEQEAELAARSTEEPVNESV